MHRASKMLDSMGIKNLNKFQDLGQQEEEMDIWKIFWFDSTQT